MLTVTDVDQSGYVIPTLTPSPYPLQPSLHLSSTSHTLYSPLLPHLLLDGGADLLVGHLTLHLALLCADLIIDAHNSLRHAKG